MSNCKDELPSTDMGTDAGGTERADQEFSFGCIKFEMSIQLSQRTVKCKLDSRIWSSEGCLSRSFKCGQVL